MSDKLSPKPQSQKPLLSWKDLDNLLVSNFEIADKNDAPSATVDLSKYDLSLDEVKREAESKGYKVTDLGNDYVRFD